MREIQKASINSGVSWKRDGAKQDNGLSVSVFGETRVDLFLSSDQGKLNRKSVLRTAILLILHFPA